MPRTLSLAAPQAGQTFDDALGPPGRRYFATGYRRTGYRLPQFRPDHDEPRQILGSARVEYPHDWSRKEGAVRVAHLSTADALVLAADAVQTCLALVHGLSDEQIRVSWFMELSVRTGARPVTALEDVPVRCRLTGTADSRESDVLLKVGTFTVTGRVCHPPVDAARRLHRSVERQGPALYTHGFRDCTHRGRILELAPDVPALECRTEVDGVRAPHGIESGLGPRPSLVDCLVFAGQMLQLLICTTEQTTRDGFGNLWLRRITFTTRTPARPSSSRARLWVTDRQDLSRGDDVLHALDVRCEGMFGTSMRGQAAYSGTPG